MHYGTAPPILEASIEFRTMGATGMSGVTNKAKLLIVAAVTLSFVLGVVLGQTVGSGGASFACPLVPPVYQGP